MPVTPYLFWIALAEILFYVSGFIVHAAAGRILGPSDYGIYGLIVTLTILIASLIGNGVPIAMSKFLSSALAKDREEIAPIKRKGAAVQLAVMGTVTAIFFFSAPAIAWLLRDPTLTPLFQLSAFIIPCFAADSFYFYYYTGIHQFNMQSILKTLRSVLRVTLIVGLGYFYYLKGFISGYIYVPLAVFLFSFVIDRAFYAQKFPISRQQSFSAKKLLLYALPITAFLILFETMVSLNLFAVKALLKSDYLTGLFNGALTISRIPNYLFYAMTIVLLPIVSHSTASLDAKKTARSVATALRAMTMLLVPTIALLAAYAGPLMLFFFGSQYLAGAASLKILSFGVGLLTIFYVMSFAFQGAGLVQVPVRIAIFGMALNAALNLILIPPYQLIGSSLATGLTAILVTTILFYHLKNDFGVKLNVLSIVKIIFSGITIFGLSFLLPAGNWTFILSGAILFATYFAILHLLGEIKKEDWQLLWSMIPGLKK